MKPVILSADNELKVYLVPDDVAGSLNTYCMEFSANWIQKSPYAEHLRTGQGACFDEADFIEYLNTWICPDEKSVFVENLGWDYRRKKWPEKYRKCPHFKF